MSPVLLGLTGPKGAGRLTATNHLIKHHGFTAMSFQSIAVQEICHCWVVPQRVFDNATGSILPSRYLCLRRCNNEKFVTWVLQHELNRGALTKDQSALHTLELARSPTWIMAMWCAWRTSQDEVHFLTKLYKRIKAQGAENVVINDVQPQNTAHPHLAATVIHSGAEAELWQIDKPEPFDGRDFLYQPFPSELVDRFLPNVGSVTTFLELIDLHLANWKFNISKRFTG